MDPNRFTGILHCFTRQVNSGWVGLINVCVSGWCVYTDDGVIFRSAVQATQEQAGDQTRQWCQENKVDYYFGPVMSGHIG